MTKEELEGGIECEGFNYYFTSYIGIANLREFDEELARLVKQYTLAEEAVETRLEQLGVKL